MSAPPVLQLTFELCRPLLDRLVDRASDVLGYRLEAVCLFGSVSRDQGTENSDIDLLVVYHGNRPDQQFREIEIQLREQREYQDLLNQGFYPEILALYLNLEELRTHPWILLDITETGKILYSQSGILEEELSRVRRRMKELGSRKVVLEDGSWYWDVKPDWKPGDIFDL